MLTGSLGDVIKESAHIALGWVRSHTQQVGLLRIPAMGEIDIHIHFPEGAVGKDGPSAGVTLATVLASLLSGLMVRSDTAMTGEITLSGAVLPVGGVPAKVMAAHRRGIRRIILPARNHARDLHTVPDAIRNDLTFVPVRRIGEVLDAAIVGGFGAEATERKPSSL